MKLNRKITLFVVLYIGLFSSNSQANDKIIDKVVKRSVSNGEFNGSVLVAKGDNIIYQNAFGYSDGTKTEKLTPHHRFNIGSISKQIAAVAIHILITQHDLSLEQPISDFITDLPPWSEKVQLKHLINYSSGLPDFPWKVNLSNTEAMEQLKANRQLLNLPGEGYRYSYYNNFLVALIIENVSGVSFAEYLSKTIFLPLKMSSTENNLNIPKSLLPTARAFDGNAKNDHYPLMLTGPSIYTTVTDLFKWARSVNNNVLIDSEGLRFMAKSLSSDTNSHGFTTQQAGFGSVKYNGNNIAVIFHDGSHINFHSVLYIDKLQKHTVIILSNNKSDNNIFNLGNNIISYLNNGVNE
jgi:CubicO group peptidase (beta-lactamase class C family)